MHEVDTILKEACVLLSELTNLTCIVQTPSMRRSYIRSLQLIRIDAVSYTHLDVYKRQDQNLQFKVI